MTETVVEICPTALHFQSFLSDFAGKNPHQIVKSCENAYITMGNYGSGWSLSIQIRNPKIGDTVIATWQDVDVPSVNIHGKFQVCEYEGEIMIIGTRVSEYVIGDEICRGITVVGYRGTIPFVISMTNETVKADDHAF